MADVAPIIISVLALVATFYQLYLQRVHDELSLKPLPQIDLMDMDGLLFIHVQNNGVGPMIVDKLIFTKAQQSYSRIQDCINIDPTAYNHIEITDTNKKILIPGGFLEVFAKTFNVRDKETDMALFRRELAGLHLKVEGHDIYNNKVSVEKSMTWFARHL